MSVYAVAELDNPGSLVKIGHASRVRARFASLRNGSPRPLTLLAHWDGDRCTEARLHATFADHRRHGEWFDLSPSDVVASVTEALGYPPRPALRFDHQRGRRIDRVDVDHVNRDQLAHVLAAVEPYLNSGAELHIMTRTPYRDVDLAALALHTVPPVGRTYGHMFPLGVTL